jgi:hypothetical protein
MEVAQTKATYAKNLAAKEAENREKTLMQDKVYAAKKMA